MKKVHAPVGLDIGTETPEEIALSIMAEIMQVQSGSKGGFLSLTRKAAPPLAIVRGAGDLATGTISKLFRCGFRVAALETDHPTVIRRTVSFAQAVFDNEVSVEGITAVLARSEKEIREAWEAKKVPIIPDDEGEWIKTLSPRIVVDAILAKQNLGTRREMAPVVIGLGPGFTGGKDVHAVIETNRGHNLGKVILDGPAAPNTGIPGNIAGHNGGPGGPFSPGGTGDGIERYRFDCKKRRGDPEGRRYQRTQPSGRRSPRDDQRRGLGHGRF